MTSCSDVQRGGEKRKEENERNGGPAPVDETTAFRLVLRRWKEKKPDMKKIKKKGNCPQG